MNLYQARVSFKFFPKWLTFYSVGHYFKILVRAASYESRYSYLAGTKVVLERILYYILIFWIFSVQGGCFSCNPTDCPAFILLCKMNRKELPVALWVDIHKLEFEAHVKTYQLIMIKWLRIDSMLFNILDYYFVGVR